ncbi:hypothetical protein [Zoogloea sp.]|uniref:hypothetical protein n=1 Tax=Zoogloea sp. TaxID=49181 RepID=UPI0025DE7864|nr:hypothetical protein [Zoogloea sp.]MCK6394240.1 hypothetical protein [Zoogloea sp.]
MTAIEVPVDDVLGKLADSLRNTPIGKDVSLDKIFDAARADFGQFLVLIHPAPFALQGANEVYLECSVLSANDYAWALLA